MVAVMKLKAIQPATQFVVALRWHLLHQHADHAFGEGNARLASGDRSPWRNARIRNHFIAQYAKRAQRWRAIIDLQYALAINGGSAVHIQPRPFLPRPGAIRAVFKDQRMMTMPITSA